MSTPRRSPRTPQRRPLPPEIYMRRRVAALVVVLLLVVGLISAWAAFGRGGGENVSTTAATDSSAATPRPTEQAPSADPSNEPASLASPAESEQSSAQPSAEESTAPEPSESRTAEPAASASEKKDSCELKDLKIRATTDRPNYNAGVQPVFYMSVENPTGADCEIDLDAQQLRFEVYDLATNLRIWADTDCYPSVQAGRETFKAGETRHFEATWSRLGSAPKQCEGRPQTPAGSYYLHAVIGDNASPATTFNLR